MKPSSTRVRSAIAFAACRWCSMQAAAAWCRPPSSTSRRAHRSSFARVPVRSTSSDERRASRPKHGTAVAPTGARTMARTQMQSMWSSESATRGVRTTSTFAALRADARSDNQALVRRDWPSRSRAHSLAGSRSSDARLPRTLAYPPMLPQPASAPWPYRRAAYMVLAACGLLLVGAGASASLKHPASAMEDSSAASSVQEGQRDAVHATPSAAWDSERPAASLLVAAPSIPDAALAPFDQDRALAAIAGTTRAIAKCNTSDSPVSTHVRVTFAPTGHVESASVLDKPFYRNDIGRCISSQLHRASVPAFAGSSHSVTTLIVSHLRQGRRHGRAASLVVPEDAAPRSAGQLDHLYAQLRQLVGEHRGRRVGHQVSRLLRLGERNDVAQALRAREQHRGAIHPERDASVRRRSEAKRAQEKARTCAPPLGPRCPARGTHEPAPTDRAVVWNLRRARIHSAPSRSGGKAPCPDPSPPNRHPRRAVAVKA